MGLLVHLPMAAMTGDDGIMPLSLDVAVTAPMMITVASSTSFVLIYKNSWYWFLQYDGSSEFDESLDETSNLPVGEWKLIRDPSRREIPERYIIPASAPFWRFDVVGNLKAYERDLTAAIQYIVNDFECWAAERAAMHRRKHRGKK